MITATRNVLAQAGRTAPDILRAFHGKTTATSAILESRTPPTGLIPTAGFTLSFIGMLILASALVSDRRRRAQASSGIERRRAA